ncbi:YolD-like family protein [Paenibacillus sp. CC-CFT747]|nr:YolD-like family protein [Paenibacillus sp. CC-CFT747]
MGKKLVGNGIWEASRMMLPEHRERIITYRRDVNIKEKPILDEQRIIELVRVISEAIFTDTKVSVTVFDEYENTVLIGCIDKIDTHNKHIKLIHNDDFTWINLQNIIDIHLV